MSVAPSKSALGPWLLLALLAGLSLWLVMQLFALRFAQGDVYPVYSSQRADPLGTKALYDSLARLPDLRVTRNVQPLHECETADDTTWLLAGVQLEALSISRRWLLGRSENEMELDQDAVYELDRLARTGSRVVLALYPEPRPSDAAIPSSTTDPGAAPSTLAPVPPSSAAPPSPVPAPLPLPAAPPASTPVPPTSVAPTSASAPTAPRSRAQRRRPRPVAVPGSTSPPATGNPAGNAPPSFPPSPLSGGPGAASEPADDHQARWGVVFRYAPAADAAAASPATGRAALAVPPVGEALPTAAAGPGARPLPWHSDLVLANLDPAWQVLYTCRGLPVVAERRLVRGSVVVATDSYALSNEALRANRRVAFVAALLGPNHTVIFDETHLGMEQELGIAGLARRYELHGLVIGLLVLVALFIWHNATSLVPAATARDPWDDGDGVGAARDAASGLLNLLRRHVPRGRLLAVCLEEWRRAQPQGASTTAAQDQRLTDWLDHQPPLAELPPVATYQQLQRLMAERTPPRE